MIVEMKAASFETLSLNLLKTFCVFAETGKVEDTAQRLRITQASVSLQLKKLEEETGQNLFKTVGRKKLLTSFARDLFQSIAPPLSELEHRLKEVSKTRVPLEQRLLRIGCRHELIKRVQPLINFPGQIYLSGMSSQEALVALRNDEIDIAIVPDPQIKGDWYSKKIFVDQPVLIANPKVLRSKSWNSIGAEIFKYPAIAYKKPEPYLNEIVEKLGGNSSNLKIKLYCEDWLSIIDTVKRALAWSVVPRTYNDLFDHLTVIEVPPKVLPTSHVYAVYSKEWRGLNLFKAAD
jgi:DNA-binding transcriptional LysR family regulator